MRIHPFVWGTLLFASLHGSLVAGCSDVDAGEGDGKTETFVDLFACGLQPTCESIAQHINPEPQSALECAAKHLLTGEVGVLMALNTPGPFVDETESLIVVLGDGKGLVQTRERHCGAPDDPPCEPVSWEAPSQHQICDLEASSSMEAACEEGSAEGCAWSPWQGIQNCQAVEDYTCDDIAALLKPM